MPHHDAPEPAAVEPCHVADDSLRMECLRAELRRATEPEACINALVYCRAHPDVDAAVAADPSYGGLRFESRFECGNLFEARRVYRNEYDLVLQPDINTQGHILWYYFAFTGAVPGQTYKFNFINMLRGKSLYNMGMKPVMYSERAAAADGVGWTRTGDAVRYYRNQILRRTYTDGTAPGDGGGGGSPKKSAGRKKKGKMTTYFTLTVSFTVPHLDDTCYMAHHYPYPFSRLCADLAALETADGAAACMRTQVMTRTLHENALFLLTITDFGMFFFFFFFFFFLSPSMIFEC